MVSIEYPVDSDTIGVLTTTKECLWDTTKSFPEFWAEICKKMRLDQETAVIGYKLSGDCVKDSARQLSTAEEYKSAMEEIQRKVRNARTKAHKLILHNLVHALPIPLIMNLALTTILNLCSVQNNPPLLEPLSSDAGCARLRARLEGSTWKGTLAPGVRGKG